MLSGLPNRLLRKLATGSCCRSHSASARGANVGCTGIVVGQSSKKKIVGSCSLPLSQRDGFGIEDDGGGWMGRWCRSKMVSIKDGVGCRLSRNSTEREAAPMWKDKKRRGRRGGGEKRALSVISSCQAHSSLALSPCLRRDLQPEASQCRFKAVQSKDPSAVLRQAALDFSSRF